MKKDYIPYVYIIKNKTTGMKYIGVRYAKDCHPDDLWVTYFTSSKIVKTMIEEFGKEDFIIKILHRYPQQPEQAILREAKYFPLLKKRDDYLNMTYSSGLQDLRLCSKAGKIGGAIVKNRGIGIFRDYEERLLWASMGGKIGSKVCMDNKLGIHAQTPEERLVFAKRGNKRCKELGKGFFNPETQRELGRRGGPKNKGFRWYNDGNNDYKYTTKQQSEKDFETFIIESGFVAGRSKNNITNRIWVNDGITNFMIYKEDFKEEIYSLGRIEKRNENNGHKNKENNEITIA
jgi:hypothetical protein